jgi:hypothetical protein
VLRRTVAGLLALLPSLGLAGCGTGAYSSTFRVTVDDPARILGADTVRVGVFNVDQGTRATGPRSSSLLTSRT